MYVIWIDISEKIASFHEVEGYERREFHAQDLFQSFVMELVGCRYRFQ